MIAAPTREVTELLRRVDDARRARQGEYERFLTDLTPRLSIVRFRYGWSPMVRVSLKGSALFPTCAPPRGLFGVPEELATQRGCKPIAAQLDPHFGELFRGLTAAVDRGSIDLGTLLENLGQLVRLHLLSLLPGHWKESSVWTNGLARPFGSATNEGIYPILPVVKGSAACSGPWLRCRRAQEPL